MSYRHFVIATQGAGWFIDAFGGLDEEGRPVGGLLPASRIGLFREVDTSTFTKWFQNSAGPRWTAPANYYSYGYQPDPKRRQDSAHMNSVSLPSLIKVGDLEQGGVILLNPAELTSDGEMEAWTLSFRTHVTRYRSFAELMQDLAYIDIAPDTAQSAIDVQDVYASSPCVALLSTGALIK